VRVYANDRMRVSSTLTKTVRSVAICKPLDM